MAFSQDDQPPVPTCTGNSCNMYCYGDFESFLPLSDAYYPQSGLIPYNLLDCNPFVSTGNSVDIVKDDENQFICYATSYSCESIYFPLSEGVEPGCKLVITMKTSKRRDSNPSVFFNLYGAAIEPCNGINSNFDCSIPNTDCPNLVTHCIAENVESTASAAINAQLLEWDNPSANHPYPQYERDYIAYKDYVVPFEEHCFEWVNETNDVINYIFIQHTNGTNSLPKIYLDDIFIQKFCDLPMVSVTSATRPYWCAQDGIAEIEYEICLGSDICPNPVISLMATLPNINGLDYGVGGDFANGSLDISTLNAGNCTTQVLELSLEEDDLPFEGIMGNISLSLQLNQKCEEIIEITPFDIREQLDPEFSFTVEECSSIATFTSLVDADEHYWFFGDLGNSDLANPTFDFINPGTYTVIHYVSNECGTEFFSTDVIIEDFDANAFFEVPEILCNQEANFSSIGGENSMHTWEVFYNGNFVLTTSSNDLIYTFSETGDYTIIHTVTNSCETDTYSENVFIESCELFGCDCPVNSIIVGEPNQITQLSDYFSNSPTNSINVIVRGTVEANTNSYPSNLFTFPAGSNICMDEGAEIIVKALSRVRLANTHVRGCTKMWKSITVEGDGELTVTHNSTLPNLLGSRIEDGQYAIKALPDAKLSVQNTTFNKNYVGIYTPTSSTVNRVFLQLPLVRNKFTSDGDLLPPYDMQSPIPAERTFAGIFLNDTYGLNVGVANSSFSKNTFDGIENGIRAEHSSIAIHYAEFKNINGGQNILAGEALDDRNCSVFIKNTIGKDVIVNNSKFNDGRIGVRSRNATFYASGNKMSSIFYAFGINLAQNRTTFISNNQVDKCRFRAARIQDCMDLDLLVADNNFNMVSPDFEFGDANSFYVANCTFGNRRLIKGNHLHTYNDIDYGAYNGFVINNCPNIELTDNEVKGFHGGDVHAICVTNSDFAEIEENIVTCEGFSVDLFPWAFNIFIDASTNTKVTCNEVYNAYASGIGFANFCDNTDFRANIMSYDGFTEGNYNGLRLNNAIIGRQPVIDPFSNDNKLNGNQWLNTANVPFNVHGARYSGDEGFIPNSRFRVPAFTNPEHPSTINLPANSTTTWFQFLNEDAFVCSEIENIAPTDPNIEVPVKVIEEKIKEAGYGEGSQWTASRKVYRQLNSVEFASDNPTINNFLTDNESSILNDFETISGQIHDLFVISPNDLINITELKNKIANINESINQIDELLLTAEPSEIEDYQMERYNLVQDLSPLVEELDTWRKTNQTNRISIANQISIENSTISPSAIYEKNQFEVNHIFLNTLAIGLENYTNGEFQTLVSIASQCPEDGGSAVYQARSMLSENDYVLPECLTSVDTRSNTNRQATPVTSNGIFLVYPNPNNGQFFIELADYQENNLSFSLYNTLGKKIYNQPLLNQAKQQISIENLPNGIYIYKIADKNKILEQEKMLIFK